MPARTIRNTHDLIASVPVDRFEIVNGPSPRAFLRAFMQAEAEGRNTIKLLFTLKTPASTALFQRDLRIASELFWQSHEDYFNGYFADKYIEGSYKIWSTQTGWFHIG